MSGTRSALIAGGSAGIGLAIAERLAADGWRVTIVGRDPGKLEAARSALERRGPAAHAIAANLAQDVAADVVGEHMRVHGRLDLLVNNAGIGLVGPLERKTPKSLDLEIDLNLRSAYRLLQESIPALRSAAASRGASHVVNVSSMTAVETPPFASAYAATKAALVALSRSAHAEFSGAGIHVTALLPGFVDTPGTGWAPDAARTRMIAAGDVAEAVRFLLALTPNCFVPYLELTTSGDGLRDLVDWRALGRVDG